MITLATITTAFLNQPIFFTFIAIEMTLFIGILIQHFVTMRRYDFQSWNTKRKNNNNRVSLEKIQTEQERNVDLLDRRIQEVWYEFGNRKVESVDKSDVIEKHQH